MRIMFDFGEQRDLREYKIFELQESWDDNKPEIHDLTLVMCDNFSENDYFVGEYNINTMTDYYCAKTNWRAISEELLTKGYCRASDFVNFIWY